jgi:hypothetical protein
MYKRALAILRRANAPIESDLCGPWGRNPEQPASVTCRDLLAVAVQAEPDTGFAVRRAPAQPVTSHGDA